MPKSKKPSSPKKVNSAGFNLEQQLLSSAMEVKKESKQIDFKEKFDPTLAGEWAQIIKDIIAMANSGGGVILFGVKDDGTIADEFDKNLILNIDPATIADKVYSYTNENFSDIKILELNRDDKIVAIFLIAEAATPIVFTKPGSDIVEKGKQRPAFVKGSVYFRHGAKSEPGNSNDIKHAFNRELGRTKRNWFEGVRKISNIKSGDEVIVKKSDIQGQSKVLQPVPGRIVSDTKAISFRPDNAADLWPHKAKDVVKKINERLTEGRKITSHDFLCIRKKHGIDEKSKPGLVYKPYKEISPRYSDDIVDWVLNSSKKDPKFFEDAKAYYKNINAKS